MDDGGYHDHITASHSSIPLAFLSLAETLTAGVAVVLVLVLMLAKDRDDDKDDDDKDETLAAETIPDGNSFSSTERSEAAGDDASTRRGPFHVVATDIVESEWEGDRCEGDNPADSNDD